MRLRAGLRFDFKTIVAVGEIGADPGAAGAEGVVLGGRGCGGCWSLGSVKGNRVAKVLGSKTWKGWYFVVLASRVVRKDLAKLSSDMLAIFCCSSRRKGTSEMPASLDRWICVRSLGRCCKRSPLVLH